MSDAAQHAIAAREELDRLLEELSPDHRAYSRATDARAHVQAIVTAAEAAQKKE